MTEMLFILEEILLPIIIMITAGFVFQKIFNVDIRTFSKLSIYLLVPVLVFTKLYGIDISGEFFVQVVPFVLLLELAMYVIAVIFSAIFRFNRSIRKAFTNSLVLINTGNYGIPLIDLVFRGNPLADSSQIFIVAIQNITTSTFGVFQASSGNSSRKRALINMIKMPTIYAILLVVLLRALKVTIPGTIMIPLNYITDAFIAFALLALGVQLASVKLGYKIWQVMGVSALKLIVAPLAAFGLTQLLDIQGVLGAALIIGLSTPTAVNTAILAHEFDNEPEFAAQVVFMTTVLCTFTLPIVIYFVRGYFGLG
jgi:hypothetical protein